MSPLIDVTNSGAQNRIVVEKASKKTVKKNSGKLQNKKSKIPDGVSVSEEKINDNSSSRLEPVKMCNTRVVNSSAGSEPSSQGSGRVPSSHEGCTLDSLRVPPLPQTSVDDVLSQAVQALSLNPLSVHSRPSTRFNRHRKLSHRQVGKSSSGHPENTNGSNAVRTPQQCGACGLEFTSLPVLTQHLAKHVYDGLYAAQWLTQAMSLVSTNTRQTTSEDPPIDSFHSVPSGGGDGGHNVRSQSTQQPPSTQGSNQ